MIPTRRVKLGHGHHAEIFTELAHGTNRRIQEHTRRFLKAPGRRVTVEDADGETARARVAIEGEYEVNMSEADFTGADDLLILGQVREWTYGAVDQETLDHIPEVDRNLLISEMDGMYARPFLGGDGNNSRRHFFSRSSCRDAITRLRKWLRL